MALRGRTALHLLAAMGVATPLAIVGPPAAAAPAVDAISSAAAEQATVDSVVVSMTDGQAPSRAEVASLATALGTTVQAITPMANGYARVDLAKDASVPAVADAAAALADQPAVLTAEPDTPVYAAQAAPDAPDDPYFLDGTSQWGLWDAAAASGGYSVRAPVGWLSGNRGSSSVVVAVIDTGTTAHSDLPSVLPGYDFITDSATAMDLEPGRDADPADPGNYGDCYDSTGTLVHHDSLWHGTHVAGIILARVGNTKGVAGIAPGVSYEPVRALGKCGSGSLADIADAITWATGGSVPGVPANTHPATVVNLSLAGLTTCPSYMQTAVDGAVARGSNVVAAAGNAMADVAGYSPANCAGVTAVAATGRAGERASYSNFGSGITISAPGGSGGYPIVSTYNISPTTPGAESYAALTGTSMATPQVAGALALVRSVHPDWTAQQAVDLLKRTATPFPTGTVLNCTTSTCGAGIVDIGNALFPRSGAAGSISGWLLDATGNPRAGITASAIDGSSGTTKASAITAADGSFALTSLTPGVYGIAFDAAGQTRFYWPNEATLRPASAVALAAGGSVVLGQKPTSAPGSPTSVAVTAGSAQLSVRWSAPTDNGGSAITGYTATATPVAGSAGSCSTTGATSCTITGLSNGTSYSVSVVATNAGGSSLPSAAVPGTPIAASPSPTPSTPTPTPSTPTPTPSTPNPGPSPSLSTQSPAPSTSATSAPLPAPSGSPEESLRAGEAAGTIDGTPADVRVSASRGTVTLSNVGQLKLTSVHRGSRGLVYLTPGGVLNMQSGQWLAVAGRGFGAGQIGVELLPDRISLGSLTVNGDGQVSGRLAVPRGLAPAPRTLRLTGRLADGRSFTDSLGVRLLAKEAALSSSASGQLTLTVFPKCSSAYRATFQKLDARGWRVVKKTKTRGASQTRTLTLPSGDYRARVAPRCGLSAVVPDAFHLS